MNIEAILAIPGITLEARFVAGMIVSAAHEASRGDLEAGEWMCRCAPDYLALIVPADADPDQLHTALLARLPSR
jgi:hypothetical protein